METDDSPESLNTTAQSLLQNRQVISALKDKWSSFGYIAVLVGAQASRLQ